MTCMRYAYCNTVYCLVFLFYWQRHPNALVIFSLKYIADFLKERNPWWLTYKFIWKVIFIPYLKMKYIFCAFVLSVNPRWLWPSARNISQHFRTDKTDLGCKFFFMKNIGFHIVLRLYQTWQLWHAIKVGRKYLPGKKSELFAKRSWITVL